MSGHWDKVIKLACKPKQAAPKAKYLDPIIAATYSDDGTLREICASLAVRLREPSLVVIHKALLVIHTMIRTGHTDNVLGFLSSSSNDVLRLRHLSTGRADGISLTENVAGYASYLEARIRAYRDLKHDIIRIQNETNREDRMSGGESSRPANSSNSSRNRSGNGKKLRQMTVEKGLLRETKMVQRQIDALLQCKFFLDSLEDELTLTTLRLMVKDLLILFQAGNEGVINVLEQYFEMSRTDAEDSLSIYKSFCTQTEGVVEYLSIARKLSNLLNVPVPNLRHVSSKFTCRYLTNRYCHEGSHPSCWCLGRVSQGSEFRAEPHRIQDKQGIS
ncbi:ANTH-domain-containing protein [Serendipita vermifera]|nr:ANTH-domain-containing protein [Serendipita vermifera]